MVDFHSNKTENVSINVIILNHINKILKVCEQEFRGGYYTYTYTNNTEQKVYVPDARKIYIQCVEALSDILLPYFDKDMNDFNEKLITSMDELLEKYSKEEIKKDIYVIGKFRLIRGLFQQLNLLLKRAKYLKVGAYEEGAEEEEE